jgi:hypothetical protein
MKDIFVSYRRSDSSDVTGRIFDRLKTHFGAERLFKDVHSIPLGTDFRRVIAEEVGQCKVLVAVVGRQWLCAENENGNPRIYDDIDFVHLEIASALQRDIPVVPVLVSGAIMPKASELPDALRDFAYRNGTLVRPDPDFDHDVGRLIQSLESYVSTESYQTNEVKGKESTRKSVGLFAAIITVTVIAVLAILATINRDSLRTWFTFSESDRLPHAKTEDVASTEPQNNAVSLSKNEREKESQVGIPDVNSKESIGTARWLGKWTFSQQTASGESGGTMSIQQIGSSRIKGTCLDDQIGQSTFEGSLSEDGSVLTGTWENKTTGQTGHLRLELSEDSMEFSGNFSVGNQPIDNSKNWWKGQRIH